jgi:hypothetical protein
MSGNKYLQFYIKVCDDKTYICYYKKGRYNETEIEPAKAHKIQFHLEERGFTSVWGDFGKCLVISFKKPIKEV